MKTGTWLTRVVTITELQDVEVGDKLSNWDLKRAEEAKLREQLVRNLHVSADAVYTQFTHTSLDVMLLPQQDYP